MSYSNNHSNSKSGQRTSSIYNPHSSNNFSSNNSNNNDDIQFRVLSKSPNKNRIKNNPHNYENVYDVMGKPHQSQKLNQVIMNESSDIFNDGIEGGGVEPSINESIRQSIQCSFVSQESFDTRQKFQQQESTSKDAQRSLYVMNRMNWITYLKVLFDQLESFNQNKQKHVETQNFIKGFKKIKHLLPLQTRNDYFKNCSEVAFSYKEVENGIHKMSQYITWDNIIDIFLTKSFTQPANNSNNQQNLKQPQQQQMQQQYNIKPQQNQNQFKMNNLFSTQVDTIISDDNQFFNNNSNNINNIIHHQQQPLHRDESQMISDIDCEDGDVEHNSYRQQLSNEHKDFSYPQSSSVIQNQNNHNQIISQQQTQIQQQQASHYRSQSKPTTVIVSTNNAKDIMNNGSQINKGSSFLSNHLLHDNNQSKRNHNNTRGVNEDFYPSFADSLINYGTVTTSHNHNNFNNNLHGTNGQSIDYQQQSLVHGVHMGHQNSLNQQQLIVQAPLLLSNSNVGRAKEDEDDEIDPCEIDSDYSNSNNNDIDDNDIEDSQDQNDSSQVQQQKKKKRNKNLEQSIISSNTAHFQTIRRTSTHTNNTVNASQQISNSNQQNSKLASALSQAVNVQDSYYATIKNSTMQQQNLMNNNYTSNYIHTNQSTQSRQGYYDNNSNYNSTHKSNQISKTNNAYYNTNQSNSANHHKSDSRNSSSNRYNSNTNDINNMIEDGQVEVGSNHSYGSSKWRNIDHQNNSGSVRIDLVNTFEDQHHNYEKSTRISSLNSIQKNAQNTFNGPNYGSSANVIQTSLAQLQQNNNNTIISHNSSQSSQSHHKNQNSAKLSVSQHSITQHSSSSNQQQHSNFIDLDLQGKGLKTFEIDYRNNSNDKRQLRSINLANNSLIKLPTPLEKTIIYMNISYNKLKSLTGIETCVNLKFLNVSGNQISSANNLVILQSMRELIFSYNQLSVLKDIGQLKNLQLLDLSYNKISEIEKIMPLQNCKKLFVLSLLGNIIEKHQNYDNMLKKMLPQVKVQDPDQIKDFSQFTDMEHVCFSEPPMNPNNQSNLIMVEQMSSMNLRQFASQEKEKEQQTYESNNYGAQRPRSKTPNRERAKSQLGQQMIANDQKLKSMVISPQRDEASIDKRKSNIYKTTTTSMTQQQQQRVNKSPIYSTETQIKMQQQVKQQYQNPLSSARPSKGNITQRNQGNKSQLSRDRSYVKKEQQQLKDKSQSRQQQQQTNDRSTSNISRNVQGKTTYSAQGITSGRSTAQQYNSSNNQTLNSQYTAQSAKEPIVKKVTLNSNTGKYVASQGKITPRANTAQNNMHTPQQEKVTHYYKKSFCQTDEEGSIILSGQQNEREFTQGTPSEKQTIRTAPTQESSNKKTQLNKIIRKDPVAMHQARMGIISPTQQRNSNNLLNPPLSTRNSNRPVTTLKQRIMLGAQALQQDSTSDNKYQQFNNTTNLSTINANSNNQSQLGSGQQMNLPQSTKNQQKPSNSFVFDNNSLQSQQQQQQQLQGRNTPQNQVQQISFQQQSRPSSQLQKFIIASQKPQNQQQQITVTSSRPGTSHTQMSFHSQQQQIPSQKLTNLPPRAYQMKTGNPGDKKSKADMSLSVISNGNNNSVNIVTTSSGIQGGGGSTAATNNSQIIQNTSMNQQQHQNQNYNSNNQQQQNNNISQSQNPLSLTTIVMNTSTTQNAGNISSISQSKNQSAFIQQNTTNQDYVMYEGSNNIYEFAQDSHFDNVSSRSMSPVLEESNNIKKLKVDLTQFMNKQ